MAWQEGKPIYLGREPNDASVDPLFEEVCKKGEETPITSPLLAHLRKASIGLKIVENTHPFTQDEWAFAHNGTIRKLNLRYTTDSQWFFSCVLADYKSNGRDIVGAITRNVKTVREVYPYTSLTFLLSNGKEFFAYRDCSANLEFYTLCYAMTSRGMLISQEKFIDAPWIPIENGSLLKVNQDLSFEVQEILPELKTKSCLITGYSALFRNVFSDKPNTKISLGCRF